MKENNKNNENNIKNDFDFFDKDLVISKLYSDSDKFTFFEDIRHLGEGLIFICFLICNGLADNGSGFSFNLQDISLEGIYELKVERIDKK